MTLRETEAGKFYTIEVNGEINVIFVSLHRTKIFTYITGKHVKGWSYDIYADNNNVPVYPYTPKEL